MFIKSEINLYLLNNCKFFGFNLSTRFIRTIRGFNPHRCNPNDNKTIWSLTLSQTIFYLVVFTSDILLIIGIKTGKHDGIINYLWQFVFYAYVLILLTIFVATLLYFINLNND